jgi:hypothetical protein
MSFTSFVSATISVSGSSSGLEVLYAAAVAAGVLAALFGSSRR